MDGVMNNIDIKYELNTLVNYALFQNKLPTVSNLVISNNTDNDMHDIQICISSKPSVIEDYRYNIELLPKNSDFKIEKLDLIPDAQYLANLPEKENGYLTVSIIVDGEEATSRTEEISFLPFDQWMGLSVCPELLVTYITPNHPEITKITAEASKLLGEWTGDPSFDAYQTQDPNRVLKQAASVYGAIQKLNINYSVPPASFVMGQRVRMAENIIQQKMGTCLDLTLLYAACLEAIGINPILIIKTGHIFAGFWLEDELMFANTIIDDAAEVSKRLASGVNEISVIECTSMVSGKNISFDEAGQAAVSEIKDESNVEMIIDVKRARACGFTPLPIRMKSDNGWVIEKQEVKKITEAPSEVKTVEIDDSTSDIQSNPKFKQWERKLLDLGLRNNLINMRIGKSIPVLTASIDDLEDALSDKSDFSIMAKPEEVEIPNDQVDFELLNNVNNIKDLINAEFRNKRLRAPYSEGELTKRIKELYRSSRSSLEENGANTLFLALGALKWFETAKSQKARYAPLILIPVEIIRKSAAQGYVIRLRDEESQVNITLLEKLKQDFSIEIKGLDPIPEDEHGIDTRKIFTIFRQELMSQSRWDIMEIALLGIFSFSQFVMWNDIKNRSDDLKKNKIVKSLSEGRLTWDATPMNIESDVDENGVFLPISADASQLYAIKEASNGKSFVLHGPPGTGKSQTITALIANALANNKKVLFVAEKMAALEVVQSRLQKIGLGPFCLELHSNKSKKKDVLAQLRETSEITKYVSPKDYERKAEQIKNLRQDLDKYSAELHKELNCGFTVYQLINLFESYKNAEDIEFTDCDNIANWSAETLDDQMHIMERLITAAKLIGHPQNHPLSCIDTNEYSQKFRTELPAMCGTLLSELQKLKSDVEIINSKLKLGYDSSYRNISNICLLASELVKWEKYPLRWGQDKKLSKYLSDISAMANHFITSETLKNKLLAICNANILDKSSLTIVDDYNAVFQKSYLAKTIAFSKFKKQFRMFLKNPSDNIDFNEVLNDLVSYHNEIAVAEDMAAFYGDSLNDLYSGENTDWNKIATTAHDALESQSKIVEIYGSDIPRLLYSNNKQLTSLMAMFIDEWGNIDRHYQELDKLLNLNISKSNANWLESTMSACENISDNISELKDWINWSAVKKEASESGLNFVISAYNNGLSHDKAMGAYCKAVYQALIINAVDSSDTLGSFSGTMFNEKIEQFRKLDEEVLKLTQSEIYCRLASKIPNFTIAASKSSEIGLLQRAIKSNGRGISIRELFSKIPSLLSSLCPCMLMSPMSAAQYLDPKTTPFDLVVFDEASQLTTAKAVGALARGKEAVIVGDPKQMPPTSFFMSNKVDEDNLEAEDLESILDDCLAINMPQTHLLWHYRSRHESLIAFSNNQFYDNKLYTFPSVNDRESKVRFVHVDGTFERGGKRINRSEAEAVVKEIIRRSKDVSLSKQSVGVVTFNISQQNLIDDLFTEACAKDPELEKWAYESEEPLFIKNLESVQGDERDVILFSITYAPDKTGKMYMNFGPINREGGWRRLNVAVSRAKNEMIVFSTLLPDQINLSRTASEGVAALKGFLEYAQGRKLALDENTVKSSINESNSIVDEICSFLNKEGYKTDKFVGHSEYKIDIGVVDPNNAERYILGILLDGDNYNNANSTRDRELSQVNVLSGLGWKILRMWTMDWWDNRQNELDRILKTLVNCNKSDDSYNILKTADNNENSGTDTDIGNLISYNSVNTDPLVEYAEKPLPHYISAILPVESVNLDDFIEDQRHISVMHKASCILNSEAPISKTLFTKRVIQSFGISRSGSRIQAYMDKVFSDLQIKGYKVANDTFNDVFWNIDQNPETYYGFRVTGEGANRREFNDIPLIEVKNAVCYVLMKEYGMSREDLVRRTANVLGYARIGGTVNAMTNYAIRSLLIDGKIELVDNQILNLTQSEFNFRFDLEKSRQKQ